MAERRIAAAMARAAWPTCAMSWRDAGAADSCRHGPVAPLIAEPTFLFPFFFVSIQRRCCGTAGHKRMLKLTHVDKDHVGALTVKLR